MLKYLPPKEVLAYVALYEEPSVVYHPFIDIFLEDSGQSCRLPRTAPSQVHPIRDNHIVAGPLQ